jgi:hypothetical protein
MVFNANAGRRLAASASKTTLTSVLIVNHFVSSGRRAASPVPGVVGLALFEEQFEKTKHRVTYPIVDGRATAIATADADIDTTAIDTADTDASPVTMKTMVARLRCHGCLLQQILPHGLPQQCWLANATISLLKLSQFFSDTDDHIDR